MLDLVAQLVNEAAREVERAAGGRGFDVQRIPATRRRLRAVVGSSDPASLTAEYGGAPWAAAALDGARKALGRRHDGHQRDQ